jgi:hypothetical protein
VTRRRFGKRQRHNSGRRRFPTSRGCRSDASREPRVIGQPESPSTDEEHEERASRRRISHRALRRPGMHHARRPIDATAAGRFHAGSEPARPGQRAKPQPCSRHEAVGAARRFLQSNEDRARPLNAFPRTATAFIGHHRCPFVRRETTPRAASSVTPRVAARLVPEEPITLAGRKPGQRARSGA